jgi:hypothetical protein
MRRLENVLVIHPDHTTVEQIDIDNYREVVRLVGGNLGTFALPPTLRGMGLYAYCDDDALIRNDRPPANGYSAHLGKSRIHGPVVIFRADRLGNEHGLSAQDIQYLEGYLAGPPSREAYSTAQQEAAWWQMHPSGIDVQEYEDTEELLRQLGI